MKGVLAKKNMWPFKILSERKPKKGKVFVGLSGGVDSSVAAALLKKQGYDVTGVFIKVWHPDFLPCNWKEERRDAMRVAAELDISFLTFDFEEEYKKWVVDYMIAEYRAGRVPNPDVMCNKSIKFGAFLKKAEEMGADFVATGHYARLRREILNPNPPDGGEIRNKSKIRNPKSETQKFTLLEGKDKNKDQSYFLWTLTQEQLRRTLFPVGEYTKPEIRELAARFKLPTAQKKDSQGVCFVGKIDMRDFLKEYIDAAPGDVLDAEGRAIGRHEGAMLYAHGQRHGFTSHRNDSKGEPLYVISKDIQNNTITVAPRESLGHESSKAKEVSLSEMNWISGIPDPEKTYRCRIRYRQSPHNCRIRKQGKTYTASFDEPQEDISVGQSLVIYDGELCAGGGVIEKINVL